MVATTPGDSAEWLHRARRVALIAAIILFAAVVVAFVRTGFGTWHATGDHALIDLRALDVGGSSTPRLGPYSRYGWSHPGPALFYALAPFARVFGARDIGILAGAIAINALALAAMLVVVRRRRDAAAWVVVVLVAAALVRAPSAAALFDPWNPYVIVLPLLAATVCAWTAADGSRWALITTVVLASFVAQSHIGAAPAAVALVGYALLWAAFDARRASGSDRHRRVRAIEIAVAVGFVVWLPPSRKRSHRAAATSARSGSSGPHRTPSPASLAAPASSLRSSRCRRPGWARTRERPSAARSLPARTGFPSR